MCAAWIAAWWSLFDFNLHIPANATIVVAIMALGSGHYEEDGNHSNVAQGGDDIGTPRLGQMAVRTVVILAAALVCCTLLTCRALAAHVYLMKLDRQSASSDCISVEAAERAVTLERFSAYSRYRLAEALMQARDRVANTSTQQQRFAANRRIAQTLEQAICLNPLDVRYHVQLGWTCSFLAADDQNRSDMWLEAGDKCMQRASLIGGQRHQEWLSREQTAYGKMRLGF